MLRAPLFLGLALVLLLAACQDSGSRTTERATGVALASADVLPRLPVCTGKPVLKPREWTQYCGDAGYWLMQLSWTSWTTTGAEATGVGVPTKGCDSTCGRTYPLHVLLTDPRKVPGFDGRLLFTHIRITYEGRGPLGQASDSSSLRDVWESALTNQTG